MSAENAKRQILGAINARSKTDEILPSLWVIVPILIVIASIVVGVALMLSWAFNVDQDVADPFDVIEPEFYFGFAIIIVGSTAAYIIFGILAYKLVNRQNEHYVRESHLRTGIIYYLRGAAGSPEKEATIASELATMNSLQSQANMGEKQRTPIAWALVIVLPSLITVLIAASFLIIAVGIDPVESTDELEDLIPFILLTSTSWVFLLIIFVLNMYMFYFLMKTMYEHDNRWNMFAQQTQYAMYKLGYQIGPPYWAPLPNRSFVLYFIAIIFISPFILYWWYVLIKDPNQHFKNQWYFEDQIAAALSK